jgi:hypothetical protein
VSGPLPPHEVAFYDQMLFAALDGNVVLLVSRLREVAARDGMVKASADMFAFLIGELTPDGDASLPYVPTSQEATLMGLLLAALRRLARHDDG